MENIEKLPKWAQQKIKKLQADLEYYSKKAEQIAGDAETNTCIKRYMEKDIPLPNNSLISFSLPDGDIEIDARKGYLEIHASIGTEKELCAIPHVSNTLYIKLL